MRVIGVLLFTFLHCCQVCGQEDCRTPTFLPPPPTCPGNHLEFYCSAFDNTEPNLGNSVWTINANSGLVSECVLNHIIWPNASAVCESFQAQAYRESPLHCFLSTLNNTASHSLHGTEVVCSFVFGINTPMEVGRGRITIISPAKITGISCESVDFGHSDLTRNLTISWTTEEDFPNQTSRYVVSALSKKQAKAEMVYEIRQESPQFISKQLAVEVELNTEYWITVRTDNCKDRLEGENATISVLLNIPPPPCVGNCMTRVYKIRSGAVILYALDITVDIIDPNISCAAGQINNFTLSFIPKAVSNPVIISRDNDMFCSETMQQCSYTHVFQYEPPVSQFDVKVTASNLVGEGHSFLHTIDAGNTFATLNIHSTTAPMQARVFLSDVFSNPEYCSFQFGTDDTYMTLPKNAAQNTSSTDVEIIFELGNLNGSTYYYNMSCEVTSNVTNFTLVMQGMFQSRCSGDDLVDSRDSFECSAPAGYKCLVVNDAAVVVFNETTAVYHVKKSSHCLNGSRVRTCMSNGYWNENKPLFQRVASVQILDAQTTVIIVVGILALLLGSSVCSVLGIIVTLTASTRHGSVIGVLMLIASILTFPVFLISYCIVKKGGWHKNEGKLKPFYRILLWLAVVINVMTIVSWIVLAVHITSNEFYSNGYLYRDDSMCVVADSSYQNIEGTALAIVCLLLSLVVALEWSVGAALWRWGTVINKNTQSSQRSVKPTPMPAKYEIVDITTATQETRAECIELKSNEAYSSVMKRIVVSPNQAYGQAQFKMS